MSPLTPEITLCPLPQTDGSCQYTCPTSRTTILTSVNGPLEVRAKDELPNDATIEVIVKPGIGVGGVRETRLSTLLQTTLKSLILTTHHPRTLIQIVAQIVQSEDHTSIPLLLSPLLNSTILSLLIAGIPLRTTGWSIHLAVLPANTPIPAAHKDTILPNEEGESAEEGAMETDEGEGREVIVRNPGRVLLSKAKSSHTLVFSKEGQMLLIESVECSEGVGGESADGQGWDIEEWLRIMRIAKGLCCGEGVEVVRDALGDRKIF
ncbi:exosome non-catalytic core subunit rrp46 [Orbilia ellipsospora]|uniref:Exosome non-catalytic core subunit rrp46 n=1 Tax=Orbilia ellipsospora TaxID=2528407 RepID=A0AAV9WYD4_9PEZI